MVEWLAERTEIPARSLRELAYNGTARNAFTDEAVEQRDDKEEFLKQRLRRLPNYKNCSKADSISSLGLLPSSQAIDIDHSTPKCRLQGTYPARCYHT
jgi:hypothetical protein